jgi:hypothetical protein
MSDDNAAPGPTDEPAEETAGMPDPVDPKEDLPQDPEQSPAEAVPDDPEHADELKPDSIVNEKSD